ncbi:MAG: hypothetical protein II937_12470 [Bacteroidales bacterium]|nr:hypothetical protein [Bacteroidales bacterium]
MKIKIEYSKAKVSKEDILALKTFIEKKKISDVKKVEIASEKPKKGEMGPGIASALTALLGSVTGPLTALAEALVEWVRLKRSEIRIVGVSGAEICISGKVKNQDLHDAIQNFFLQEKTNVKTGAKRERKSPPPPPAPAEEAKK